MPLSDSILSMLDSGIPIFMMPESMVREQLGTLKKKKSLFETIESRLSKPRSFLSKTVIPSPS